LEICSENDVVLLVNYFQNQLPIFKKYFPPKNWSWLSCAISR